MLKFFLLGLLVSLSAAQTGADSTAVSPSLLDRRNDSPQSSSGDLRNTTTNVTLSVDDIVRLVGEVFSGFRDSKPRLSTQEVIASEKFDESLAQGPPQHYKSFNTTTPDLYMRFILGDKVPSVCSPPFNASDIPASWIRMTYGVPWRVDPALGNSSNIVAWQLSRPLYKNESLYHAGWGFGFMAAEAGNQCGYNYATGVSHTLYGPLEQCTDHYVPVRQTRCVNVVMRDTA